MAGTHHYIDLLKYWVAAIRFEESLTTRPKAIRTGGVDRFDWRSPSGSHRYFKTARDEEMTRLLLGGVDEVKLPVGPEQRSFLARQVRSVYYRQDHAWQTDETTRSIVVVGHPALYFPRTDELATLVRLRASIEWLDEDEKPILIPSKKDRQKKRFPKPPTYYVLRTLLEDDDAESPLSLDQRILSQALGFPEEVVQDFSNALAATDEHDGKRMLAALIELLEVGDWPEGRRIQDVAEHDAPVEWLFGAVKKRLIAEGNSARTYDLTLTYDSAQNFTTHHLRRDLSLMISGRMRKSLVHDGPLRTYLSGDASPPSLDPLLAQSTVQPMTPSQRNVAERFLGSVFTSAQGPPGTGKTRLILDVAAHMLVCRMKALATHEALEGPTLLVTSTNNRAVDQVLDILQRDLPWGLRSGSQQVTETATIACIDGVLNWLQCQGSSAVDWSLEKASFLEVYEAAMSETAPHESARLHKIQRLALKHEMLAMSQLERPELYGREAHLFEVDILKLDDVLDRMTLLKRRFNAIARQLGDQNQRAFESTASAWQKLRRGAWRDAKQVFSDCGLKIVDDPIVMPKKGDSATQICEAWLSGITSVVDDLDDLYEIVDSVRTFRKRTHAMKSIEARFKRLSETPVEELDHDTMNRVQHSLYLAAQRLRKSWLLHRRDAVVSTLTRLRTMALEFRSTRRFFQDAGHDADMVRSIFPVIGSTLLSVANVIGGDDGAISHVVIDEGGQCHPAYAVSALMRAKHALIIGDVHQLQPIFSLSVSDEARVQKASRIQFDSPDHSIFRVHEGCGNSAQMIADRVFEEPPKLVDHYRSHQGLISFCDQLCGYQLDVHTPQRSIAPHAKALVGPLIMTPVFGVQKRSRGSWYNELEVEAVLAWVFYLLNQGITIQQIAILTPYLGQLDVLRTALHNKGLNPFDHAGVDLDNQHRISIGTVHRFQGGERDVILYSPVISTTRSLHFQNQRVNLLNVAVSRARQHFITLGHHEVLAKGQYTRYLVERSLVVELGEVLHD